jgi:hypothetical protein
MLHFCNTAFGEREGKCKTTDSHCAKLRQSEESHVPIVRSATLLGMAAAMTAMAAPKAPLAGNWGGPDMNLTLGPDGGRLEQGCASGSFGPVRADAKGRFKSTGRFEVYQPGPQRADEGAGGAPARFEGVIQGDTLRLTVRPAHGAAETHTLIKGKRAKLIRCY